MNRLETKLTEKLILRSPIMMAAGCGGHSDELSRLEGFDFSDLGAFVTKGVTLKAREGNPPHRLAEVRGGIINSIGLQNKGLKNFMEEELLRLEKYNIPVIVNLSASSIAEFEELCEKIIKFDSYKLIKAVEINVSCPNVNSGGLSFGVDSLAVMLLLQSIRHDFGDQILITKLTPNVTDIVEVAEAAIEGGTNILSMINTIKACAVDIENKKFILGKKFGGLSGPAIKSIGLYMVHECFTKISRCKNKEIPIIGIGGIINYRDVLEYLMVGASAVQIGTGFFLNSNIFKEIRQDLENYLEKEDKCISDLIGLIC